MEIIIRLLLLLTPLSIQRVMGLEMIFRLGW